MKNCYYHGKPINELSEKETIEAIAEVSGLLKESKYKRMHDFSKRLREVYDNSSMNDDEKIAYALSGIDNVELN